MSGLPVAVLLPGEAGPASRESLEHGLQIVRQVKQSLRYRNTDDSLLFEYDIYPFPVNLSQMIMTEGISFECERLARNIPRPT